ncbi:MULTISPECIES: hypothetical protein, partial [unclassified Proteiniphilum]|uniref:hypothetical protein n=1 Tax=Proteiniphilum sp. UBA5310 TaxID=1947275 RepID=UPI002579A55F
MTEKDRKNRDKRFFILMVFINLSSFLQNLYSLNLISVCIAILSKGHIFRCIHFEWMYSKDKHLIYIRRIFFKLSEFSSN